MKSACTVNNIRPPAGHVTGRPCDKQSLAVVFGIKSLIPIELNCIKSKYINIFICMKRKKQRIKDK